MLRGTAALRHCGTANLCIKLECYVDWRDFISEGIDAPDKSALKKRAYFRNNKKKSCQLNAKFGNSPGWNVTEEKNAFCNSEFFRQKIAARNFHRMKTNHQKWKLSKDCIFERKQSQSTICCKDNKHIIGRGHNASHLLQAQMSPVLFPAFLEFLQR